MKVLIATALVAFGTDDERELSDELASRLRKRGHQTEFLRLPLAASAPSLNDLAVARSLEISNSDLLIALSFPAGLLRHPRKVLWLGPAKSPNPAAPPDLVEAVRAAVRLGASEARAVFTTNDSARDSYEIDCEAMPAGRSWGATLDRLLA